VAYMSAGLDWSMRRQVISLLKKLKKDWSLLIVTHDAGDLIQLADRAWALDHGILSPYALDTSVQLTA